MQRIKHALKPLRRTFNKVQRKMYSSGILAPSGLTLPHFLGLGAPQAGSTWLHINLSAHPDVFMCSKKEAHYFTREFDDWSLSYYASLFDEGMGRICGEITPGYNLLTLDRIRFVHDIMPNARLILIIRNPVDRAWSSFRREGARVAKEIGIEFSEIEDDKAYKYFERFRVPAWGRPFSYEPGIAHEHYTTQIDRWTSIYPEEQLFVGSFDELKTAPEKLMQDICEHIGARTDIDWSAMPLAEVVNKNPEHEIPERFRSFLRELYDDEYERLRDRFGTIVAAWD